MKRNWKAQAIMTWDINWNWACEALANWVSHSTAFRSRQHLKNIV